MVNAEKHRKLLEENQLYKVQHLFKNPIIKDALNKKLIEFDWMVDKEECIDGMHLYFPSEFELTLRSYFKLYEDNRKHSFGIYWGGINGAINQKKENWDYTKEEYYIRDGLRLAKSNRECMEGKTIYSYIGINGDWLYDYTKKYLEKDYPELDVLYVDAPTYFNYEFDVFKIFEEVKNYDMVFIKNIEYELSQFLIKLGLNECINHCYFFINRDDELIDFFEKKGININDSFCLFEEFPNIANKFGKTGFELFLHLKEWENQGEVSPVTRDDPEYRAMKKTVKMRDNYTCQCCGYQNKDKVNHGLEVHHIYGYKDHLDYRAEADNCVTLCKDCHKKYHSIYGKNATPINFSKFIRDYNSYYNVQMTLDNFPSTNGIRSV